MFENPGATGRHERVRLLKTPEAKDRRGRLQMFPREAPRQEAGLLGFDA